MYVRLHVHTHTHSRIYKHTIYTINFAWMYGMGLGGPKVFQGIWISLGSRFTFSSKLSSVYCVFVRVWECVWMRVRREPKVFQGFQGINQLINKSFRRPDLLHNVLPESRRREWVVVDTSWFDVFQDWVRAIKYHPYKQMGHHWHCKKFHRHQCVESVFQWFWIYLQRPEPPQLLLSEYAT